MVSGNIIEVSNYSEGILQGFTNNVDGRSIEASEEDKQRHRIETLRNAKRMIKRLINANYTKGASRLLTLTYRANMQDIDRAYKDFKNWIVKMTRYYGYNIKYVAIPELQDGSRREDKKGRYAIHFHVILFNIPKKMDLEQMRKLWIHGSVNVKRLKNCDDVGSYLTMYMDLQSEFFFERKIYLRSKNLLTPVESKEKNPVDIAEYLKQGYELKYRNTFINERNSVDYAILTRKI